MVLSFYLFDRFRAEGPVFFGYDDVCVFLQILFRGVDSQSRQEELVSAIVGIGNGHDLASIPVI